MKKPKKPEKKKQSEPVILKAFCPECGQDTAAPSKHPKRWDGLMRLVGRIPLRCQRCACRFYMSAKRYDEIQEFQAGQETAAKT